MDTKRDHGLTSAVNIRHTKTSCLNSVLIAKERATLVVKLYIVS